MFVTTFYSYKGGVGRTMALANVAAILSEMGRRVLIVDFDLEAPGIPSYGPFEEVRGKPGIVDFVHDYLETNAAPAVSGYITKCEIAPDIPVWVMPAGDNTSPHYSQAFSSIDWAHLYEEREGYLLIEDLKNQWAQFEGKGFDYVLVDSRTGNTDVSGICTRQIPDVVVLMFIPTRQNIVGLGPIVELIRTEPKRGGRHIELLFCPSNLPEAFDEDDILGRSLQSAREELRYGDPTQLEPPVVTIGHWANMALLDLPVIALSREKSKLARQYRKLAHAIMAENREDRDGAIVALTRMPEIFEAARKVKSSQASTAIPEKAKQIQRRHPEDSEIASLAAEVFSEAQLYEDEEHSLSVAIKHGSDGVRHRLLRAVARINLNKKDEALTDLIDVLTSKDASSFDFMPAARLLSSVTKEPEAVARQIFGNPETKSRAMIELSPYLMTKRENLDFVADGFIEKLNNTDISDEFWRDIINSASIALIGARRFSEAIDLIRKVLQDRPEDLASRFNLLMAKWGNERAVHEKDVSFLCGVLHSTSKSEANRHQCAALACALAKQVDDSLVQLDEAHARSEFGFFVFSCWTYLYCTAEDFRRDLAEMEIAMKRGEPLKPPFLGTDNRN
ncbi:AAA family ATPase [Sphingomicrobium sp. XHP0239]|uniref:tyrosine-protein kinase family protein n=1 Tax=Sphingomicrobium maritimum TaxID=3133972 RepID=UPI0031CCAFB4